MKNKAISAIALSVTTLAMLSANVNVTANVAAQKDTVSSMLNDKGKLEYDADTTQAGLELKADFDSIDNAIKSNAEAIDQNKAAITQLENSLNGISIRVNATTGKLEWKGQGADTFSPFSGSGITRTQVFRWNDDSSDVHGKGKSINFTISQEIADKLDKGEAYMQEMIQSFGGDGGRTEGAHSSIYGLSLSRSGRNCTLSFRVNVDGGGSSADWDIRVYVYQAGN